MSSRDRKRCLDRRLTIKLDPRYLSDDPGLLDKVDAVFRARNTEVLFESDENPQPDSPPNRVADEPLETGARRAVGTLLDEIDAGRTLARASSNAADQPPAESPAEQMATQAAALGKSLVRWGRKGFGLVSLVAKIRSATGI